MVRSSIQTQSVAKIDPVWDRMRTEAEAITRDDPSLGGFIFAALLNHASFEDAMAHRLAQRLGNAIGPELIGQAFEEAIAANPEIGIAARADILATFDRDPACHRYVEPFLYFKGFHAVQTHRMAHQLWHMGRKDFAYYLQSRSSVVYGVDIHPAARIGRGIMIDHAHSIVVGETAIIDDNVSILHSVTLGGTGKEAGARHPHIHAGVLIGAGAKILGHIDVGHCSRIAAGSVVLHDVPPNRTVAGVPAKVVGYAGCDEPSRIMDHNIHETEEEQSK